MKKIITDTEINRFSDSDAELNHPFSEPENFINYKLTNKSNPFADQGAWFGYYFNNDKSLTFNGPNVISQEIPVNAAKYLTKTSIIINGKKYQNFNDITFTNTDGLMQIDAIIKTKQYQLKLTKTLFFVNSKDALITFKMKGKSKIDLNISLVNESFVYEKINHKSSGKESDWIQYYKKTETEPNQVKYQFTSLVDKKHAETLFVTYKNKISIIKQTKVDNGTILEYQIANFKNKANETLDYNLNWYESFYFDHKDHKLNFDQKTIKKYVVAHETRWKQYLHSIKRFSPKEQLVLKKAINVLVGNWLAPNGKLKTDIIIPSRTYRDFIGAYAWDTYKSAYGISFFDPQLAERIIRGTFAHQIDARDKVRPQDVGMIPDAIFYNYLPDRGGVGENWNERNTKPPLAIWAVYQIYKKIKKLDLLKDLYHEMKLYLTWWINNRGLGDNSNLLCYGATKHQSNKLSDAHTIIEAASWESGMDNAPRFDWDRMDVIEKKNKKTTIGYIINQSSVCLNSFFYHELVNFIQIAKILKKQDDVEYYSTYLKKLKQSINEHMFSEVDKFYHDMNSHTLEPLHKYGLSVESFIPLFVKLPDNLEKVTDCINHLSPKNFLTKFPFPTVAVDNERFDEFNYWRGPVWISFQYFATKGIHNYDKKLGSKLYTQIINNLNAGPNKKDTLRENYSAISGSGLATTNFSWTAAMLIAMIHEIGG